MCIIYSNYIFFDNPFLSALLEFGTFFTISMFISFSIFLAFPRSFSFLFAPFKLFTSFSLALTYKTGLDCFHCKPSNHNSNNKKRKK